MEYINTNKLEKLKINKDNTFIVLDFDRTITTFESLDSWDASGKELDKEFKDKQNELYKYYRPIEMDYTIKNEEKEIYMEEWYNKCINLYYEHHLTKEKFEKSMKDSKLIFREGTREFLKKANQNQIPLIILSAGIGNVIEQFLKANDCYFENMYIISNFIEFDKNGNMKKFNDNVIHTGNKKIKGNLSKEFQEKIRQKEYGILVGDLIEDKKMVEKDKLQNVITIGLLQDDRNLEFYKENFDIVLNNEDATFTNIEKLVFNVI